MGTDRHLFPGGNTPLGFFSYYPYILPQDNAKHIFCLKGGPGTGKSTFMKKIGEAVVEKGHTVEYMHCSSDPHSLDGLVIPELRTALIDGTAPHVVDPKNPGAVDEIVNLGQYWSLDGIRQHRAEVLSTNAKIGRLFARVYRYLAAARELACDEAAIQKEHSNEAGIDAELEAILPLLDGNPKGVKYGRERKLFASAITPDGLVNYLGSLFAGCSDVYELKDSVLLAAGFLKRLAAEAIQKGLDVEAYYCPMDPETKIEHLIIPALKLAFTTANPYYIAALPDHKTISFEKYVDAKAMSVYADTLRKDGQYFAVLLKEAVATLRQAKALHDLLETYYIPYMDFNAEASCREEIIDRILN